MIVSLIVAVDDAGGIGKDGRLPWRLSSDMRRFKEITMGHHIIAGRKTYESIGRPLPGRETIVVTRNPGYTEEGISVAHSLAEAIELARSRGETEAIIVGGAEIYREALAVADRLYLTQVDASVDADTYFPEWDAAEWKMEESATIPADEKNQYACTFRVLSRQR
jgi:dihydrofolate reductase